MKKVYQTKVTSVDHQTKGNCFRACLASISDQELEQVPEIELMGVEWIDAFIEWIRRNNLEYYGTRYNKDDLDNKEYNKGVDGYLIVFGKSPREHVDKGHSVIYKNGVMMHDPHPSGDGLVEIEGFYMIERKS